MPGELLSTLLLIFLIIFVFVLIVVAVQVYLILKDLRVLVNKLNELSLELEKKIDSLLNPVQIVSNWVANLKNGWQVFEIFKGFLAGLDKRRRSREN